MVGYFIDVTAIVIIIIQVCILLLYYLPSVIHRIKIKNRKKITCYDACCSQTVKRQLWILSLKNIMLGVYVY